MWTPRLIVFAAILSLASAASSQSAPTALTQAVALTQAAKTAYAFDVEIQGADRTWRARFAPDADPRLRLIEPQRTELSGDERRAFDAYARDIEGVSWCASENMGRVADVRLLREDATSATYAFQPTPESVRGEQARRFADRMRGEFTLSKGAADITSLRIFTPEAFSPAPLVQVRRVNIAITCHPAPTGRRYAAETVSDVSISAFGQDINQRTVQRARNLQ
ncbi:MAG: hypothetical protein H7124_00720 [Phycisphaerales bacterium]|nr:hypothetical protein [Hyphomonadaceae bacterium]